MKIGLYDADGHKFPNLPLMKISAWHKSKGDSVEFAVPLAEYDRVYVSRVFGDEYSKFEDFCFNTKEIVYGGTGFAITIENGREVYTKTKDTNLPYKIEHIYPDYSLYPTLTKNTAYGFLTRGCPNDCGFCIVSKKEGRISKKVADLSEFWRGQSHIKLLDANLLACKDKIDLLNQLAKSGAKVDFTQGIDARFITDEVADLLAGIKIDKAHFAFDFMKNERAIIKGLQIFQQKCTVRSREAIVYMLTNYDTTIKDDLYRVNAIRNLGFQPDVRIYRKSTAPRVLRDLQRWCNNRFIFHSCDFMDYVPRKDGKTIRELYFS